MVAYLVLVLAALSRCLPHWMHTASYGFTAVGAGMLFFGSRLQARSRWQAIVAVLAMAATDYYLTVYVYSFPFAISSYVFTWVWYAALVLFASAFLGSKRTAVRVTAAALFSATGFFVWNNGAVWLGSHMYPHTLAGLEACYAMGLPFYRNDLACTLLLSGALFGLPVLVREMSEMLHRIGSNGSRPA
ncbi:DUF6580 family putative transport protein [Terriglobus saanensis]|uniref:Uncharacterized protein n=1 Tax=Terriglobus saanensis (strain ATCC BAA-1853 / DSM 23119 / SP1PR4) TaxID=401053 RepID=E8V0P1_TERSS|nr:DUF6580 family putative transport protein [Terriglobus saanensis]ADV81104.1 hypothetical protein AciPR4_0266 [Terriglobus saanensis SP1PR4]